jgi:hypothetical protein
MFAQIGIRASGTYADFVRGNFNSAQLRQIPDADQLARGEFSGGILHHNVSAAGDGKPFAGFVREKR